MAPPILVALGDASMAAQMEGCVPDPPARLYRYHDETGFVDVNYPPWNALVVPIEMQSVAHSSAGRGQEVRHGRERGPLGCSANVSIVSTERRQHLRQT